MLFQLASDIGAPDAALASYRPQLRYEFRQLDKGSQKEKLCDTALQIWEQQLHRRREGCGLPRPLQRIKDFVAVLLQKILHLKSRTWPLVQEGFAEAWDLCEAAECTRFYISLAQFTESAPYRSLVATPEELQGAREPCVSTFKRMGDHMLVDEFIKTFASIAFEEPSDSKSELIVPSIAPQNLVRIRALSAEDEKCRAEFVPVLAEQNIRVFEGRLLVFGD